MRRIRGKRIGMVFQDPLTSLNPLYTVAEQLTETIRTHMDVGEAEARERAIALLTASASRPPAADRRLSASFLGRHAAAGGDRAGAVRRARTGDRRRADHRAGRVGAGQIIDLIKEICAERGASVMLITHDMGVIAETADRVAVLYAGRLAEIGPVRDVITAPDIPIRAG
jgi:peptide/nickel transport system ATP-binding protein